MKRVFIREPGLPIGLVESPPQALRGRRFPAPAAHQFLDGDPNIQEGRFQFLGDFREVHGEDGASMVADSDVEAGRN